jgi:peptidyl-prolyl cis-trans isomerase SurA
MVSRSGDDAVIRHILRIPQITEEDIELTKGKLDSIRSKLIAGTITFGEAVDKYSEDESSKFTAGLINGQGGSYVTIDELDKDLVRDLNKLKVGEYSPVLLFKDDREKAGLRIVNIRSKTEPHRENLRDDYNKISLRALEEKKNQTLTRWFETKLPTYYIMVDKDYQECESIRKAFSKIMQASGAQQP